MEDVTVLILTKNEEINLPDCLESVKGFAERIVIVDSGRTDATRKIAEDSGADFYVHPFENNARQLNWGFDNTDIRTKWTLRLDADERLTPALREELSGIMREHDDDSVTGVTAEAWLYFLGRKIKHGTRNKRKIIMFRTGTGRMEDRRMDEHAVLSSGHAVECRERFIHDDHKDLTHWINKMNWYATREMQDYVEYIRNKNAYSIEGNNDKTISSQRAKKYGIYYKFPKFLRCRLLFIWYYIFRLGFLDGKEGYIFHYMYHCWYRSLVDAKILEQMKSGRPFEETGDLK